MASINIEPIGRADVFEVIKKLSTLEQQAIVRPNNPPPGIAGYLFDVTGDERIDLKSEITDHWVEDNSTIQDQIALLPEEFEVKGLVAELVFETPTQEQQSKTFDPLPINPAMSPELSIAATEQQANTEGQTTAAADSVTSSQSLFAYYTNQAPNFENSRQAKAFNYFYQLWKARELCTVETPWGYFTNMAIASVSAEQPEETRDQTTFSIKFKKIRFAQDSTISVGQLAGRALAQRGPTTENGIVGQKEVPSLAERFILSVWRLGQRLTS